MVSLINNLLSQFQSPALGVVIATFLLAGFVKGVVGLGLPTIAMGLLSVFLSPTQAAVLLLLPSLVTNLWQMSSGPNLASVLRRLWPLQVGVVLGTVLTPVGLTTLNPQYASMGLGLALVVYALSGLWGAGLRVPQAWRSWATPVVGLVTGGVTAATGVFVVPAVPYVQALGLRKEELVQALGLSFTVSTLALWWRLALDGVWSLSGTPLAWSMLLPLLAALLGMAGGQWLRGRLSELAFKRTFFVGMLLLGLYLLSKGG